MKLKTGDRVRVTEGSGLSSGRQGRIVPRNRVKTDGRGVPLLEGHYKPLSPDEHVIEDESGRLFTMFASRLRLL